MRVLTLIVAVTLAAAGCGRGSLDSDATASPGGADCADVIDVGVIVESEGSYRFEVTVQSADTGWEKYADKWEVRAPDGSVLGERVLAHPHVGEQPFTRSQGGIRIPAGVSTVTVVARDSVDGFCGRPLEVEVP